ncbi:hypothetical protein P280DRAFT_78106 [Massarina eburnea CBS 473.64]|uniref:Uncharacterized protein n=1 Tax=Massarina eburnea CBS 473.64 TaxID=1395130 RepID=A0A6A6RU12_9PLEO|nr:hypothetical protein P280DRAFT_78106 [Massarina eburnea CBS 473.64]
MVASFKVSNIEYQTHFITPLSSPTKYKTLHRPRLRDPQYIYIPKISTRNYNSPNNNNIPNTYTPTSKWVATSSPPPRKVSTSRSNRASLSATPSRGRLSTSGLSPSDAGRSRGTSTSPGLRKGSAVLQ